VVFGGVDIVPQIQLLRAGVEVLVRSPGRLLDHVQQKTVMLGQVEILVLDEADACFDMGFMPDIRRILALLPAKAAETCCFSATFSEEIKRSRIICCTSGTDRSRPRNAMTNWCPRSAPGQARKKARPARHLCARRS